MHKHNIYAQTGAPRQGGKLCVTKYKEKGCTWILLPCNKQCCQEKQWHQHCLQQLLLYNEQQHQEKQWQQHCSQLLPCAKQWHQQWWGSAMHLYHWYIENNNSKSKTTISQWQQTTETCSYIRTAVAPWAEMVIYIYIDLEKQITIRGKLLLTISIGQPKIIRLWSICPSPPHT